MKSRVNARMLQIGVGATILLILIGVIVIARTRAPKEENSEEYRYSNVAEQVLADEVVVYLQNAAGLGDTTSAKAGNEAVENYRLIVSSNVDAVNDDHTKAIQERIGTALKEYAVEDEEELSGEDITALSAGVAELVWQSVLSQLETATKEVEAKADYYELTESLQQQIKELEERKMKVSIRANIDKSAEVSKEDLLAMVEGMTEKELEELARSLGLSKEELEKLLDSYRSDTDKEVDSKLKELEKELTKEIRSSTSPGKDGKDGEAGAAGERGDEGKDGVSGKSVFIRYAENENGLNMTERPIASTKYMGTYSGTKASTNPSDYSWAQYVGSDGDSVWIRYAENANGLNMTERPTASTKYMGTYSGTKASTNPSDYSWSQFVGKDGDSVWIRYAENAYGRGMTKQPNDDTKYMGTYIGEKASTEPEDYTWTRYSDATISFSDGTLYITQ